MLFDTHCHLDVTAFDDDREAVLGRARKAGVSLMLNPAYDLQSSRRAAALAEAHDDVIASVGVHPNDAIGFTADTLAALRSLALTHAAGPLGRAVVAIGEIGLDYHWKTVPPEQQAAAFVAQLALARELDLPVIIHCRDAYTDCLELLRAHGQGLSLVMHAFGGKAAHMRAALDMGYHIGIGGPVTYPSAHGLRDLVKSVPLDRLVLETDSPYLTPQPHRGKRNEPAYIRLVADRVADVRQMSVDRVAEITAHNGRRLFGLCG